jgi:hypothetical protein
MKRILILVILGLIGYGGYVFYQSYTVKEQPLSVDNLSDTLTLNIQDQSGAWENVQSVLGASISNAVETGKEWMSEATNGASEPIVNRAISNFQEELKSLPSEQVDRIKYDFCKPIVDEYEQKEQ